jgi:hypothetical protein
MDYLVIVALGIGMQDYSYPLKYCRASTALLTIILSQTRITPIQLYDGFHLV